MNHALWQRERASGRSLLNLAVEDVSHCPGYDLVSFVLKQMPMRRNSLPARLKHETHARVCSTGHGRAFEDLHRIALRQFENSINCRHCFVKRGSSILSRAFPLSGM